MPQERFLEPDINLAFRPSLVAARFSEFRAITSSKEEAMSLTYDLCREDLSYYFLEKFAKKKLVNFHYRFIEDNGERVMVSGGYEPLGDVTELFANGLSERAEYGIDFSREEAELEGFLKIKAGLLEYKQKTSLVLVSPPPTSEDKKSRPGYADYSLIYFGFYDPESEEVDMYAWRNYLDLPELTKLANEHAGKRVISSEALSNDFLRNPVFKFGEEAISQHRKYLEMAGKAAEVARYRGVIDNAARELVEAVSNGADCEQLNMITADIELEFVKIVNASSSDRPVFDSKISKFQSKQEAYGYLALKYREVDRQYGVVGYENSLCGGSMFSRLDSGRQVNILDVSVLSDLVAGGLKDKYGTRQIHCETCGAAYNRDYNKLEERCRKCGGTKGIAC